MTLQNQEYISLGTASKGISYSQEYLSLLVRKGKIHGKKIGRNWYTTRVAVAEYIASQKKQLLEKIELSHLEPHYFQKKIYTDNVSVPNLHDSSQVHAALAQQTPISLVIKGIGHILWDALVIGSVLCISFVAGVAGTRVVNHISRVSMTDASVFLSDRAYGESPYGGMSAVIAGWKDAQKDFTIIMSALPPLLGGAKCTTLSE